MAPPNPGPAQGPPVCVVTGGAGFIGAHLLRALCEQRRWERIEVLDLVPPPAGDPRVRFHRVDLRAPVPLELDCEGATCYHLAAVCKEPGFEWDEYFAANHVGTANLCAFASRSGITNLVYTSTEMVFRAGEERHVEDGLKAPDTAYGTSKLLGELEILRWLAEDPGRRARIVRPGVVFGLGGNGNFTRLYRPLSRRRFFYVGCRNTVKSCVYVKDVVRCLLALTDDEGERIDYNLAYPVPTTIEDICQAMVAALGVPGRIPTVPYRLALAASYLFEALAAAGVLRTGIHHRRIQKLYHSTHMASDALGEIGFSLAWSLPAALRDWRADCEGGALH